MLPWRFPAGWQEPPLHMSVWSLFLGNSLGGGMDIPLLISIPPPLSFPIIASFLGGFQGLCLGIGSKENGLSSWVPGCWTFCSCRSSCHISLGSWGLSGLSPWSSRGSSVSCLFALKAHPVPPCCFWGLLNGFGFHCLLGGCKD